MSLSRHDVSESPGGARQELRMSLRMRKLILDDWRRSGPTLLATGIRPCADCMNDVAGVEEPDSDSDNDADADVRLMGCARSNTEKELELDDSDAGVNVDSSDPVGEAGMWPFSVSVSTKRSFPV